MYITDIAISKVPFVEYFGFTKEQSKIMQELAKGVLVISKESNDSNEVAVVLLHNHPSTQTFSLQDIQFFVQHPMIEVMTVVSNQGTVHYIKKDKNYDYTKVFELFRECVDK